MVLHGWDEARGLALWEDWSRVSPKFKEGECAEKWSTFRGDTEGGLALGSLVAWARETGPIGGPDLADAPTGPRDVDEGTPTGFRLIGSQTLELMDLSVEWLVENILVADRLAVLGGPMKTLKTSVAVDLGLSVAGGRSFLGRFPVPRACRTLICSAESGLPALRGIARRVAQARGLQLAALGEHLIWSDQLPTSDDLLEALAGAIRERAIGLVVLDPLYLLLQTGSNGVQPSDLYGMGRALRSVCEPITGAGATVILVHHFHAQGSRANAPPELADLTFAGVKEYARQWILLGRRSRYEPESGRHELFLSVGGSDGHSGDWHLDVDEGRLESDFSGRRWGVSLASPAAARVEDQRRKVEDRDRKAAEQIETDARRAFEVLHREGDGLTRTSWTARTALMLLRYDSLQDLN